jgi:hypothetical protein
MKKILLITVLVSLTMANIRAESPFIAPTPDLANAGRAEVELAANEDAVAWHAIHPGRHNDPYLRSVGRARGLTRGIRNNDLLLAYLVNFDASVRALELPTS